MPITAAVKCQIIYDRQVRLELRRNKPTFKDSLSLTIIEKSKIDLIIRLLLLKTTETSTDCSVGLSYGVAMPTGYSMQ